jgi:hypothetical protein
MNGAQVRIVLDLGDEGDTWVTVVPVSRSYPSRSSGVVRAVGEAAVLCIEAVIRDREQIAEKLIELERQA